MMDPEGCLAHRFTNGSPLQFETTEIPLPDATVLPFDATAIFAQLRSERERD